MAGRRVQAIAEGRPVVFARERGFVRTRDLTAIGIPRRYLARMCDEGLLVKVIYGLHRAAEGVNKRPKLTPPSFGISMAWLADRRRDPTPINSRTLGRPNGQQRGK